MSRYSLRARVNTFYAGMLALALIVFSIAVYLGVRAFLTRSLERSLSNSAESIVTDYLVPLDRKGDSWFLAEMSESYPPGSSDPFVRVTQGGRIRYQSGDMRDPYVNMSELVLPSNPSWFHSIHRETANGQRLMIYTLPYRALNGSVFFVETGTTIEPIRHVLRSLTEILLVTTPVILILATFGGYFLMSQPLKPVVTLTEQAERVGRERLGERLPVIQTGDELERLSLSLNRMIDRLEEALAHNHRFSADASHELRTPLTIIRGELESLIQMPSLPLPVVDGIGSALEESNRMAKIVHSLMTISRLDGGGEQMEMVPVDLVELVKATLEHMVLLAEEKQISLRFEYGNAVVVSGDPMRLKQVVVNLVDNAIKYTPDSGEVKVTVTSHEKKALLWVTDTGIGIPATALPFVFDRFYRSDLARSRESGGTGLGLAIVKAICSAHDGSASVESVVGRGASFRIELPLLALDVAVTDQVRTFASTSSPYQTVGPRDSDKDSVTKI